MTGFLGVSEEMKGGWRRPVLRRLQSLVFHTRLDSPQDVLPELLADALDIETIDYRYDA